jgi:predicted nuclease with TOPRIM domain
MATEITAADVIRGMWRLEGQQEQLIARLDRLEVRMDRLEERIDRLDGRIDRLDGRIDRVEGRLDRMIFTMWTVGGGIIAAVGAVAVKLFLDG